MKIFVRLCLLLIAVGICTAQYTPTSDYCKHKILGFNVLVNKELSSGHSDLCERTLKLLESQLYQVTRVVPREALKRLREQKIWVEYKDRNFPCMCYHPSAQWLSKNGYNPEKAGGVEICGAEKFLEWTKDQPWMVLHELAHGYHHQVVGHDHSEVNEAFKKACKSNKYESVLHINGKKRKAYALNNVKEYFAETAEAFYGTNDFYPFVRSELKRLDPTMYDLHKKLWAIESVKR